MHTGRIASAALFLALLWTCPSWGKDEKPAADRKPAAQPAAAPAGIKEVTAAQLKQWTADGEAFMLIDVREDGEWQAGHIVKAIHVPRLALPREIGNVAPKKDARIVLYCQGGVRSAAAADTLQRMGYTNVFSLAGGFKSYQLAGLPVEK